jgi:DNA-binding CsgD family transcriptional regulator
VEAIRLQVRIQLERLVRTSDERWGALSAAIAKGLPVSAALFDPLGRLIWASAAAERELGTLATDSWLSLSGPGDKSEWRAAALDVLTRPAPTACTDDLLAQRVEITPGVPVALVTRTGQRETMDRRVFAATRKHNLTPRESEIVLRIASGLSNKEIAHELGSSVRTVEGHVFKILKKCGCGSRTELIAKL